MYDSRSAKRSRSRGRARNTAALAASEVLKQAGAVDVGLELEVEKGLPLAGGLGGSAASAVAGAISAALSQVIWVRGRGTSCSQPLLAKRPS